MISSSYILRGALLGTSLALAVAADAGETGMHGKGDAAAGQAKAAVCAACHGNDGNSANPEWPSLAGQHPRYLVRQIAAFKEGKTRSNALMLPMVSGLSEQDMWDLAAWFSSQPARGAFAAEDQVALGQKIYRAGIAERGVPACGACHSPSGTGNGPAAFPRLSGQHAVYIANQLRAYRSGERSSDPNAMMREIARFLSDEEITAVSEYVAGLH